MKMRYFLVNLLFTSLLFCHTAFKCNDFEDKKIEKNNYISKDTLIPQKGSLFFFKNDTLEQKIYINFFKNKIEFNFYVKNFKSNCNVHMSGFAINKNPDSDPELDEDEMGLSYPSIQYLYEKDDTYLAIRVAMKERDKVMIESSDQNVSCPKNSVGVLNLKK